MKTHATRSLVILLALSFFVFTGLSAPPTAQAQYHSQSDELPGMESFPTTLAIIAGVAVVGTITYLLVKKGKDDKKDQETTDKTSPEDAADQADPTASHSSEADSGHQMTLVRQPEHKSSLGIYFDLDQVGQGVMQEKSATDFSELRLKAGVSLSF